jgi:hypothetical protein
MDVRDAIERAVRVKSSADGWIGLICVLEVLASVLMAPFTIGISLLGLLTVPPTACLGCIATQSKRTTELQLIIAKLMVDDRPTFEEKNNLA